MWNWIVENRQWIFSGIGVAAIGFLFKLLRSYAATPSTALRTADEVGVNEASTASKPSGNEIAISISKAPPFQREQMASNYVGLDVSWPVIFDGLYPLRADRWTVRLRYGAERWGAILRVAVNIADYPRLKTAPDPSDNDRNSFVRGWIRGKIVACNHGEIEIEPSRLEFFD
jgi:hypothetical protein